MEVLTSVTVPRPGVGGARRRRFFWHLHFWAGITTAPILVFAAITGLIFVFTPQIEAFVHRGLDVVVVPGDVAVVARSSLDAQVAAARTANPGTMLRSIVPAWAANESTRVTFGEPPARDRGDRAQARTGPPAGGADAHTDHLAQPAKSGKPTAAHGLPDGRVAYVNPYTASVMATEPEMARYGNWAKKLHSTALQGDGWRWLLELGASWMLMMLLSGIYLFWPQSTARGGPGWRALIPRLREAGPKGSRIAWRDLHALFGIAMSLMLAAILVTGLTWSKYAGDNFRTVQAALGQSSPRPPGTLKAAALLDGGAAMSMQAIFDIARRESPDMRLQLTPPQNKAGTWRVTSADSAQPGKRVQLVIDQANGNVLYRSGWEAMPILSKATAVGIPFHRGEFGWWNQALLIMAALATLFSVISGGVMWLKRRPAGKLAAPLTTMQDIRAVPLWLWPITLVMAFSLPVFGVSLAVFALIEAATLRLRRRHGQVTEPA